MKRYQRKDDLQTIRMDDVRVNEKQAKVEGEKKIQLKVNPFFKIRFMIHEGRKNGCNKIILN